MHILSPETDNCPSWISRRERMTVENISWSISTKECCRPRRGLNPRPPGLQSDGASNWATEASWFCSRNNGICDCKSDDLLPQITNFQYSYPHSNAFIHLFCLKKCFVKEKVLFAQSGKPCKLRKNQMPANESNVTWWHLIPDSILQKILLQIFDIIQWNVTLHMQVH